MLESSTLQIHKKKDAVYMTGKNMENLPGITHLFSTRLGGVSTGVYSSMNLSFTRGDDPACVSENYRRIAALMDTEPSRMVMTYQTHTDNLRIVTETDAGKGVVIPKDYTDVDGLITDRPDLTLGVYIADCVPVLLADPVKRVVAAIHSGWRGTALGIGKKAVDLMEQKFGCQREDLYAAIGPSVCKNCYEVSEDVIEAMKKQIHGEDMQKICIRGKEPGKYQLDLWETNRLILQYAGIKPEHMDCTDVCTCCHPEELFSHRKMGDQRGNLGAFIRIRP